MYIREYMTNPVITVTPDTSLDEALNIVREHHIRRLPVVENNGKLVGLVTREMLRGAPSSISALGTFGMRFQLSRVKVRDLMITDVITVTPDSTVEEAYTLGLEHQIGTLPVVDSQGKLVGMVTNTDLNNIAAQVLGFGQKGVRLHIFGLGGLEDIRRCQIIDILSNHRVGVLSAFSITPTVTKQEQFVIRMSGNEGVEAVVDDLKKLGLTVEVRES